MLDETQVNSFIENGFVRLENAFPAQLAAECRAIIWNDLDANPDDPATWPGPVVMRPDYADAPFAAAAGTARLHEALDDVVGRGRWVPRRSLGAFVIRFPDDEPSAVDGWHIDVSFAGPESDPHDYLTWRANIHSTGRALLMLFLFSDTGEQDAPTRLRIGSHLDVARLLEPEGAAGLDARELSRRAESATAHRPIAHATGRAGDVYLCHPFLVHAGQPNRGTRPRFMAQPNLYPKGPLRIDGTDGEFSPVEIAIRKALGR
ncbi:phytanoyl-CoA dioxygenase family protein [Nocardia paucivorans]|uniref:phytanoyl-CoA dioxygenase family protein n=1 Tax=Nocardia paucivorans TaxID=114259 RepID=UPI00031D6C1C|nr:phytanoyl-CoA dioxygenase family protein [Nocardia paucivorans]